MPEEVKRLQPGRYLISSKLQVRTESNIIGIKEQLFQAGVTQASDIKKVPVVYFPEAPLRSPSWTVSATNEGTYLLKLDGFNAVAEDELIFGERGRVMTWEIKPQAKDPQFPLELYTIESAAEPGNGWIVETDKPDENTQVSYGPLLYLPIEPQQYVTNALWYFIPDDEPSPDVIL